MSAEAPPTALEDGDGEGAPSPDLPPAPSLPPPAAAPAAAAPGVGFGAVLEAANALRKQDERIAGAPTIEDISAAARAGEEFEEAGGEVGEEEEEENEEEENEEEEEDPPLAAAEEDAADAEGENGARPAYSAATVAAISSLMTGEGPPPERDAALSSSASSGLSLQDRAAAMMSVYQGYLHEEAEEGGACAPAADFLRREEIKLAALDRFRRGDDDAGDAAADDGEDEEEEDGRDYGHADDPDDDDLVLHGRRRHAPRAPTLPPRRALGRPTAATTVAAFRLRAEAALRAAGGAAARAAAGGGNRRRRPWRAEGEDDEEGGEEEGTEFWTYEEEEEHRAPARGSERRRDAERGLPDEGDVRGAGGDEESAAAAASPAVYGMHILDRDQRSLKRKVSDEDEGVMDTFNGLCDELGVTPATHPVLHRFYSPPQSGGYRYPIFRGKKCRRALIYGGACVLSVLVAVALASALTNGFEQTRRGRAPALADYREDLDWRERQKQVWERVHAGHDGPRPGSGAVASTGNSDNHDDGDRRQHHAEQLLWEASAAYRPVWYDRRSGWTGQTYREARAFCRSRGDQREGGNVPCPYEVYCPVGGTPAAAGLTEEEDGAGGESWAPVADAADEWVRVVGGGGEGAAATCELYSQVHGRPPGWRGGEDHEALTRHILCCRAHPLREGSAWGEGALTGTVRLPPDASQGGPSAEDATAPDQAAEEEPWRPTPATPIPDWELELFQTVAETYDPTWYSREDGWKGQTYQEALEFCARSSKYIPCPYEAYCPGGRGKLYGGLQDPQESWSAIIDDQNDWVQVGNGGECYLYSEMAKELPVWGMTGEDNEEITRHIMCCRRTPDFAKQDVAVTTVAAGTDEPPSKESADLENAVASEAGARNDESDGSGPPFVARPEPHHGMTQHEAEILRTHRPVWFDVNSGWKGTTYDEARAFCTSIPRGTGGALHLCPLAAYCPNGPRASEPLYLQMPPFDGIQWAPISNQDNDWIMVGDTGDGELTCLSYRQINHRDPPWSLDGTSAQLKEHILCCEGNSDDEHPKSVSSANTDKGEEEDSKLTSMPLAELENSNGSSTMTILEKKIQDLHSPAWYNDKFGWQGTTYEDAKMFCESISHGEGGTLHLCPLSAYCPNGPRDTGPLYLQMEAFSGIQWAPISNQENEWVMIGDADNGELTCQTYRQINHRDPIWGLDGQSTQLKQNILCCEDNSGSHDGSGEVPMAPSSDIGGSLVNIQQGEPGSFSDTDSSASVPNEPIDTKNSIIESFNPIWFDIGEGGWEGGSHDDAVLFCEQFGGAHGKKMELCPYAAYCPSGPGNPVIGGHATNFIDEGEQWAPVFGKFNHWVLIGRRGQNDVTTCLSHVELMGQEPSWGLDDSNRENKKHVMCCSPLQ